jgi:hypothetical protein
MPVTLFMDEHVPQQITIQLRRRGVDVRTVVEEGLSATPDGQILEHARMVGWILFTQDVRFRALAEDWQRQGRSFSGLLFGHQQGGSIGQFVKNLELVAKISDTIEWQNKIEYLPY